MKRFLILLSLITPITSASANTNHNDRGELKGSGLSESSSRLEILAAREKLIADIQAFSISFDSIDANIIGNQHIRVVMDIIGLEQLLEEYRFKTETLSNTMNDPRSFSNPDNCLFFLSQLHSLNQDITGGAWNIKSFRLHAQEISEIQIFSKP